MQICFSVFLTFCAYFENTPKEFYSSRRILKKALSAKNFHAVADSAKSFLAMSATALKGKKRRFSSLNHQNLELFCLVPSHQLYRSDLFKNSEAKYPMLVPLEKIEITGILECFIYTKSSTNAPKVY